ncbi:MAG: DMT family transporter, partial [Roseobacter sp.]
MQPVSDTRNRAGLAAWVICVIVGASWQLATRLGVTTSLTPIDLALLRYALPTLVLLPILLRQGFGTKGKPIWVPTLVIIGGGLPFGLLGMAGAQFAPASHMGAVLPGSMPVFVALLSAIVLGERFGRNRIIGLTAIVFGVACVVGTSFAGTAGGTDVLVGDALFIMAGVFWAIYTVAYRK